MRADRRIEPVHVSVKGKTLNQPLFHKHIEIPIHGSQAYPGYFPADYDIDFVCRRMRFHPLEYPENPLSLSTFPVIHPNLIIMIIVIDNIVKSPPLVQILESSARPISGLTPVDVFARNTSSNSSCQFVLF